MRTIRLDTRSFQLAALGMALAACGYGQSHHTAPPMPTAGAPDENPVNELPVRPLNFTAGDPLSGIKTVTGILLPIQCTGDGAFFVDTLSPFPSTQQTVSELGPKSSQGFDTSAINDLHGTELLSFFPGDDHVSLLVRATRETTPLPGESRVWQSTYRFFVARFNRQGNYLKSIELALHNVRPSHIAELSTGEYLLTGFDRANDLPRLYLVDDDGQVIRTLTLSDNLSQYTPSADPNSAEADMNQGRWLGSTLMTPHGNEVLVWRRGATGPILSVGAHGSSRQINLDAPKGYTLANIIPSDQLWIAHFQDAQHPPDQAQDFHQMPYYQFDPSDGSLTAKLALHGDTPAHTPATVACEEQGEFLSFLPDEKGQMRILSAK